MQKQDFRCFDNIDRPAFAVLTSVESDLSAFAPVFQGEYAEKNPNGAPGEGTAKTPQFSIKLYYTAFFSHSIVLSGTEFQDDVTVLPGQAMILGPAPSD